MRSRGSAVNYWKREVYNWISIPKSMSGILAVADTALRNASSRVLAAPRVTLKTKAKYAHGRTKTELSRAGNRRLLICLRKSCKCFSINLNLFFRSKYCP